MNYKDCYLIVENASTPLRPINNNIVEGLGVNNTQQSNPNGSYILEGMFTNLNGIKNNNGRIYEKEMFMPFYEKCKLKAQSGSFIGECDHPKRFETQFKTASHIIEDLWFDENTKSIMGRIRILNGHPIGEMVKSLIDNGITINVSSRSAGLIDKDGRVQLKEVFTWDLVTVPGFEGTQMNRIQESLESKGIDPKILESHTPSSGGFLNLSPNFGLPNFVEVYNINSVNNKYSVDESVDYQPKNNIELMDQNVKMDDFKKLFSYVNENLKSINNKVGRVSNNNQDNLVDEKAVEIEYIKKYLTLMGDKINDFFEHHEYTTGVLQDVVDYQDYQTKVMENIGSFSDYLSLNLENVVEYSNYLGKNLGQNAEYSNYVGEILKKLRDHSDYLSENLNNSIGYTEISNLQVSEEIDKLKAYSNYLKEGIEDVAYIGGNSNQKEAKFDNNTSIVETLNIDNLLEDDLSSKIDFLIESVSKEKQNSTKNLDILNVYSVEKRQEFNLLSEDKKQELIDRIKHEKPIFESDAIKIWEEVTEDNNDPAWLRLAPKKYLKIWEGLSEGVKEAIAIQANSRYLNSQYEIDNFWITRTFNQGTRALKESQADFSLDKLLNSDSKERLQPIRESKEERETKSVKLYGVSDEELDRELGLII